VELAVSAATTGRRGQGGRPRKPPSPAVVDMVTSLEWALASLDEEVRDELAREAHSWPSSRYRDDPATFTREVLGVEPWSKQIEILEAIRDNKRVAIVSGHKCGKSTTLAMIALWFYCSFPDARVCMTSVTARQVDAILYREVRKLFSRARRPIDGEPRELARSGIKAADFREIVGFTAKEVEAIAGVSGANVLYLPDESSGIPDANFEAIEGNLAGGGRICMASNPTRCEGYFYEACEGSKARFFKVIRISSEDTPNAREGREVIPGLAGKDWIDQRREEYGEDSPFFQVRVKGRFVKNEEAKIVSLHLIELAEARWEETQAEGRLQIGIDPAGEGTDETVFAIRRGLKALTFIAVRNQTAESILVNLLGLIQEWSQPRERPFVVSDAGGEVGDKLKREIRAHLEKQDDFDFCPLDTGKPATRQAHLYGSVRDELWANVHAWLRAGGAIPEDTKLEKDLHAPQWHPLAAYGPKHQISKATDKRDLRKILHGRSPDRGDALCLAVWEPTWLSTGANQPPAPERRALDAYDRDTDFDGSGGLSPYASDVYGGRGR
jgi:phage terminase large subunit